MDTQSSINTLFPLLNLSRLHMWLHKMLGTKQYQQEKKKETKSSTTWICIEELYIFIRKGCRLNHIVSQFIIYSSHQISSDGNIVFQMNIS